MIDRTATVSQAKRTSQTRTDLRSQYTSARTWKVEASCCSVRVWKTCAEPRRRWREGLGERGGEDVEATRGVSMVAVTTCAAEE